MSAVNVLETAIVTESRKGPVGGAEFDLLVHKAQIVTVPLQADHVDEARAAWREFGKGNRPSGLNFCDCCAYALSRVSGESLLFKGQDFARTNVASVIGTEESNERTITIALHRACYQRGFFDVPVEYDRQFGQHNSEIEIVLDDATNPIAGVINRTAQRNGTPRILGHAELRDYFRSHFQPGDSVSFVIESPRRIRIRSARL